MACSRGCCDTQAEHYRSISMRPGPTVASLTERRWGPDMDAYKRLRMNGLQPKQIDGSARIEAKADTTFEVASGRLIRDPSERRQTESLFQEAS